MNSLARAVREIVVGRRPIEAVSGDLSIEERSALKELEAALGRSPQELGRLLSEEGPASDWWAPSPRTIQASS